MTIKIAFFVHGFIPWDCYGVPRHVERLAQYLTDKGHKVFVITVGRPNLPKIERFKRNLVIYRTNYISPPVKRMKPYWSVGLYTINCILEASYLVIKEKIQILHGHTIQHGGLQSALVSKITGKPCIITIHGSGLDKYPKEKMPLQLSFLRDVNLIICQKMSAIRKLRAWGFPDDKLSFVTEGCVDTKKFRPNEDKQKRDSSVVTFVGRLIPFKGPQLLLEAAPYILSKKPNTIIQFVGEGRLKKHLMTKAISMDIKDHVYFLGFRTDVDEILRNSDVFVSLSPYENFTDFALLEAMATGVPVVATDVGETRTIIKSGKTGLLTKYDPKDLADKILKILNDELFANRLSRSERELILKEYSIEIFGKKHEEIYRKIIHEKL
ncbi:MAG: glycosyltransferase family 4 protein [Promethearchaeota archaeon]